MSAPESATVELSRASIHYVRAGQGPALILLHGFPQDGSEWNAILPRLARRYTVVAPDLRGIGASKVRTGGYDAATMAEDMYELATALRLEKPYIVAHDIGGMVGYAYARLHPTEVRGLMLLDQILDDIAGSEDLQGDPSVWHGPFMQVPELPEKLVIGRSDVFFGYFLGFGKMSDGDKARYIAAYTTPEQLTAAFGFYRAMPENGKWNQAHTGPIDVPLYLGAGVKSPFARLIEKHAQGLRDVGFKHVESGLIEGAVHYVVDDQPDTVAALIEKYA